MLESLAYIFLLGMLLGSICKKLRLPSLLGMLFTGIVLGPYMLNVIDDSILNISTNLRQIALIIILTRAGLNLNVKELKEVGRPAILMCFVPACFEIIGMVFIAPKLLGLSIIDAAILGTVIAAVSPAVIVPKMLHLLEHRIGTKERIPQMIMAGASVDDVFVIVLFTAFTGLAGGKQISVSNFVGIPISIILGILVGCIVGYVLGKVYEKIHIRDSSKVIIMLCLSFLIIKLENVLKGKLSFSGLLAIMSMGIVLLKVRPKVANRLSVKYSKLWVGAEILLFVLVGATVDIKYAFVAGPKVILLILMVLLFRMLGVYCSLIKTTLNVKEKIFVMIAYTPKATVQAAIGGIPLAMGLGCGELVLTVAVLAILITAPLGALGIDVTYHRFLENEERRRN